MDSAEDDARTAIVYAHHEVRVCEDKCSTCIFRPGNLMRLRPGRRSQMVRDALQDEGHITCHSTLDQPLSAICRGFADLPEAKARSLALRVGVALGILVYVDPEPRADDARDPTTCSDLPTPCDVSGASAAGGCLECADAVG